MSQVNCYVVTHDSAATVKRCLESINGANVLVYDNASADNTCEIVENLGHTLVHGTSNIGHYAALKALHGLAEPSDYICWVDSDDSLVPGCIEKCLANIADADMIYTQWLDCYGENQVLPPAAELHYSYNLLKRCFLTQHFRLIKTASFPGFDLRYNYAWDYYMSLLIGRNGKITQLREPLYLYNRSNSNSVSMLHAKEQAEAIRAIRREFV